MSDDHAGTDAAADFWADPAVQAALQTATTRARRHHHLDETPAHAAVLEAISRQAHDRATAAVAAARDDGTTWRTLARALGTSISGVRHRYDARVIEQRRASERRRRNPSP